jgi:hypothetical protein
MKNMIRFTTTVLVGLLLAGTALAQSGDKAKLPFELKLRVQPRFEFGDLLIDKDGNFTSESDVYLRRLRLTGKKDFENVPIGKKAWAEFVLQMDKLEMNFNKGVRQDSEYKVGISTAEAVWLFADEFALWFGYDVPPFYRNTSSGKLLTFDGVGTFGFFNKATGDTQVHMRLYGKAGKGIFKYWLGYGDGVSSLSKLKGADSNASAVQKKQWGGLYTARIELAPPGWVESGWDDTALPQEKYVALGAGYALQNGVKYDTASVTDTTYKADGYVLDLSGRFLIGKGALTGQAAYLNINKDYGYKKESPNGYWVQAGFLIPGNIIKGRLEPVVKYEVMDHKKSGKNKTKEKAWTLGFNHYFSKHNLKWGYNLSLTDYEDDVRIASKSGSRTLHQIQFQFDF